MDQILENIRTSLEFLEAVKKKKKLPEWIKTHYPGPDFSAGSDAAATRRMESGTAREEVVIDRVRSRESSLAFRLELLDGPMELSPENTAWNLYFLARIIHDVRSMCPWLLSILDSFMARHLDALSRELNCRMHAARSFALKHMMDTDPFRYAADALDACLQAREFDFRDIDFDLWVLNLYHEGAFRIWQLHADYRDNLEKSIACSMELLEALDGPEWQKLRRAVHNNLGMTYDRRVVGNRADNIEQALQHYRKALEIAREEGVEGRFPSIINNLGYIYRMRIRGDKAENIETAIRYLQRAWELHHAAGNRMHSAQTLTNLGVAYCDRLMGDHRENLYTAIRYYRRALRILDRETYPGFRAWTLHNLGVAWHFLAADTGGNPLERAIACYEEALTIRRPDQMPMDWLLTTRNLSRAYSVRNRGDISANRRKALALLEGTMDVVPPQKHLMEWAQTHVYHGIVHGRQVDGGIRDHLESAAECFRTALTVLHPDIVPVETREAALWLGRVLIRLERFEEAETALKLAAEADRYRYRQMYISQSRSMEIETGSPVYFLMAHVLAVLGRTMEALEWLEQGKNRMLTERLRLDQTAFEQLPAERRDAARDLTARLQALRIEHYIPGRPIDEIIRETRDVQAHLETMMQSIREHISGFYDFSFSAPDFINRLTPDSAAIEFNVTEFGTDIFIMTRIAQSPRVWCIHTQDFKRDDLNRFMRNWIRRLARLTLDSTPESRASWGRYVVRKMKTLSRRLMVPVHSVLLEKGFRSIRFIPHLSMHLLPLHLMPTPSRHPGRLLMDDAAITYLPSMTIGLLSRPETAAEAGGRFLGISNPTLDLPWSAQEVKTIRSVFSTGQSVVLEGADAVPETVVREAGSADYVHFACHARFDLAEPYRSYLSLAAPGTRNGETVAGSDAPDVRDAPVECKTAAGRTTRLIRHTVRSTPFYLADIFTRVRLGSHPLVVLSCCESSLSASPETADEFIGFAAGFLGSGARAVLSAHWLVDDRASSVLMERFYRNIVERAMDIPDALSDAQHYLRGIPEFSEPFFWGAFRIHGAV
ncbi:MAG TPA: CHAT domain-containing protein [bacterium]|nr:CHAT domain-containing protein [bacterium]